MKHLKQSGRAVLLICLFSIPAYLIFYLIFHSFVSVIGTPNWMVPVLTISLALLGIGVVQISKRLLKKWDEE